MATEFQFDVFLSHKQADMPRMRRLAERLRAAGLRQNNFGLRISAAGGPLPGGAGIGLGGAGAQHRWDGQLALSRSGQRRSLLDTAPVVIGIVAGERI